MHDRTLRSTSAWPGSLPLAPHLRPDPYLWVCLVLGLILFAPLAADGLPQAPDAALHYYRAAIWRWAWDDGVPWPRWSTLLFRGYGYPVLNFTPPMPYVLAALASFVLPGLLAGFKLVLLAACLSYPAGMYLWARSALGSAPASLVAAAAYTFATFRFRELYFIGGVTQFLAWSLYPWVLAALLHLARRPTCGAFLLAVGSLAAMVLAHNISTLLFAPVLAGYWLCLMVAHRRQRSWPWLVAAVVCAVLVTAAYWLPVVAEVTYTRTQVLTQGYWDVRLHFLHLHDFFASVAPPDGRAVNPALPFNYGPLHLLLAGAGALAAMRPGLRPGRRGHLLFALALLLSASFMMLPDSYPLWRSESVLRYAEYPWRLFGIALLGAALLAGAAVDWLARWPRIRRTAAGALVLGLVLGLFVYQFPRPFLQFEESPAAFLRYETTFRAVGTTAGNEFLLPGVVALPSEPALSPDLARRALDGSPPGISAQVVDDHHSSLTLDITATAAAVIQVAQFYFPGWRGRLDGDPVSLRPGRTTGLIELEVPAGQHRLELRFGDTPVRSLAAVLSVAGLLVTLAAAAWFRRPGMAAPVEHGGPRPDIAAPVEHGDARSALVCTCLLLALLLLKTAWIGPHTTWFRLTSPPGQVLPAAHPAQAPVGRDMLLLGWDLARAALAPGSELEVTLYWQATAPLEGDLASFVHLVAGPEAAVFAQSDHQHPGYMPTTTWPTARYVVDAHRIHIPADAPQVAYQVVAGLYDPASGARWGETTLALPVHVVARSSPAGAKMAPGGVRFQEGIELVGYELDREQGEIALTLFWRAAQRTPRDYQVFVHLLTADGSQVAGADGQPVEGLYPSSQWLPGQLIADHRRIPDPGGSAATALAVGLYDLTTMRRLAVEGAGRGAADSAAGAQKAAGAVRLVGVNLGGSAGHPEISDDAVLLPLPPEGVP